MKGKRFSDEARSRMGRDKGFISELRGRVLTVEQRRAISIAVRKVALRGPDCPSFKDGKTAERRGFRFGAEYKRWRFDVFARDGFTCQQCGDFRGGNLNAHHVKPFADHPGLRFVVSNGITLCEDCHKQEHSKQN